ncbi:unnamed protein product, partial [Hapterophycus canaliculatus]
GDPRGIVSCKCSGRGQKTCGCVDGVAAMEILVKAMGLRLVKVCRQWSSPRKIRVSHVRMAMPGEMREYLAWKEAHAKRGTKNEAERGADLHLSDDDMEESDDDVDDDDDVQDVDDDDDDDEGLGEAEYGNHDDSSAPRAAAAATTAAANGEQHVTVGDSNGGGGGGGGGGSADAGACAGADFDKMRAGAQVDTARPWQKQQKRPSSKGQQQREGKEKEDLGEAGEWAAEEEEVAARMEYRKVILGV